ncbi:MAG: hypothetical protein HY735_36820 [Verrucomicrobia bacterium]|nr:hypothetical protein [Verrucomicrobiota bacterium]
MLDQDTFGSYLEAVTISAKRARTILMLIATASILALTALWNIIPTSWLSGEIKLARYAHANNAYDPATPPPPDKNDAAVFNRARLYCKNTGLVPRTLSTNTAARSAELMEIRERLQAKIDELRKTQREKFNFVTIPFFGVTFDVNDLGLTSGIAFSVLLMMYRYSRARELANLRLAFAAAKRTKEPSACYDLLSMNQVFDIPPAEDNQRPVIWRVPPRILDIMPIIAQILILYADYRSKGIAFIISPINAYISLGTNIALLLINTALTASCLLIARTVDAEWAREFKKWKQKQESETISE